MKLLLILVVVGVIVLALIMRYQSGNKNITEAAKVAEQQVRRFPWMVLWIFLVLMGLLALSNFLVDERMPAIVVLILNGLYLFFVAKLLAIALACYLVCRFFLRLVPVAQSIGTGLKDAGKK